MKLGTETNRLEIHWGGFLFSFPFPSLPFTPFLFLLPYSFLSLSVRHEAVPSDPVGSEGAA